MMQRPPSMRKTHSQRASSSDAPMEQSTLAPLRSVPAGGRSLEAALPEDVYMEQIMHKLQLLNYGKEFCRRKKPYRKSLDPTYFAVQQRSGANEQFFYFTSLAAWLLQLSGVAVPTPKEFDDPNSTLNSILQGLRALGFANPAYPPNKLTAGHGKEVCALLDGLLDTTIERRGIVFEKPVYSVQGVEVQVVDDDLLADDADIATMATQDTQPEEMDDEIGMPWMRNSMMVASPTAQAMAAEAAVAKKVLTSTVDPMQWKLEVERVAPKLRLTLAADMRDWRQHLEAAHGKSQLLTETWPEARSTLQKLATDVAGSMEKVDAKERQLNNQFEGLMGQYQDVRQQLLAAQQEYNRCTEQIGDRNNELHRLGTALEDVKQQLSDKGTNLSDASPLVRLKAAMESLKTELRQMELRIGVVSHNLVSLSLSNKQAALKDAARKQHGVRDAGKAPAH